MINQRTSDCNGDPNCPLRSIITITLVKPCRQSFVFRYPAEQAIEAMRCVGRLAADPEMPLSWNDAASLTYMMQQMNNPNVVSYGGYTQDGGSYHADRQLESV